MEQRLLIKGVEALLPGGQVAKTDIAVEGAKIKSMGEPDPAWHPDRIIDGTDKFAIPGFVNAHTHAAMTLFRSFADDMPLMDWLRNKIWPAEANLTGDDVYWGTIAAIAEMLSSGTTTFADMYFFMDKTAQAVVDTGIRAVLSRGMAGVAPNAEQAISEAESLFCDWHGAGEGRLTVMLGPHAPYTCPPPYLKRVVALAQKLGAEIHIHLAETASEVCDCLANYGKPPILLMDEVGILDCGVLAAHCVHVSPEETELLRKKQVRIAHNPGSNMKLASGIAPIPSLLAADITVGLGTDGAASNNNLDMLEELRLAALLHKAASGDAEAVPAVTAVNMATSGGATAVGLGGIVGSLAPGFRADICLFDMRKPHWHPRHDRLSLLTYAAQAADTYLVMVDGKVLYENGCFTTIDEERLYYEIETRSGRLTGFSARK